MGNYWGDKPARRRLAIKGSGRAAVIKYEQLCMDHRVQVNVVITPRGSALDQRARKGPTLRDLIIVEWMTEAQMARYGIVEIVDVPEDIVVPDWDDDRPDEYEARAAIDEDREARMSDQLERREW